MTVINLAAINGNSEPFLIRAEDLGTGTADSPAGKVLALHNHDAIFMDAWNSFTDFNFNKNYYSGTFSTSGDNTIIASPGASSYISIKWLHIGNESTTETTAIIKSGATIERFRCVLTSKSSTGSFRQITFPESSPLNLDPNQALIINLNGANSVGVSLGYTIKPQ